MSEFGRLLRQYRRQSSDPERRVNTQYVLFFTLLERIINHVLGDFVG